ncbi:uncharacterized protein BJ171DRAFT_511967 [Polychytrium aggregatum]|uniref:uncharacterized protein n=1 Tax=Polychytrium aggregatum TaxID=110093 RepID=UPI0022FEC2EF|nr:uncharacterized protein BJ171DRAFT_511967 [Polychytrium aggregatum]KAI9202792.1 hypothetical protein BJ171DRAFT_511967 [Polychytrium aggregatum]
MSTASPPRTRPRRSKSSILTKKVEFVRAQHPGSYGPALDPKVIEEGGLSIPSEASSTSLAPSASPQRRRRPRRSRHHDDTELADGAVPAEPLPIADQIGTSNRSSQELSNRDNPRHPSSTSPQGPGEAEEQPADVGASASAATISGEATTSEPGPHKSRRARQKRRPKSSIEGGHISASRPDGDPSGSTAHSSPPEVTEDGSDIYDFKDLEHALPPTPTPTRQSRAGPKRNRPSAVPTASATAIEDEISTFASTPSGGVGSERQAKASSSAAPQRYPKTSKSPKHALSAERPQASADSSTTVNSGERGQDQQPIGSRSDSIATAPRSDGRAARSNRRARVKQAEEGAGGQLHAGNGSDRGNHAKKIDNASPLGSNPQSRPNSATPVRGQSANAVAAKNDESGESASNSTPTERRLFYEEYITSSELQEGLRSGKLVSGSIRINKVNRSNAYVTVQGMDDDVMICGQISRNRSLEGDMVAVRLLEGKELTAEKSRELQFVRKRKMDGETRQKKVDVFSGDANNEEVEDIDRPLGKVVYIMDRRPNQYFSGTLHLDINNGSAEPKRREGRPLRFIWFKPTDKRAPYMMIPVENGVPKEFFQDPDAFSSILFKAGIYKWRASDNFPFGSIMGTIGQIGEIPIETEALLIDNGIAWKDFSESVLQCLPDVPWHIPAQEYESRRDFRSTRIFTIDPQTARDLDDAVSCVELENGNLEVGVHIADVSYFVPQDSALDVEAYNRATTVYLVQNAIPMLPRLLCEELCSLNPGVERLAFSVVWEMDRNGNIQGNPWFGRSIIKSCAKLSYDHAQAIIEGKDDWNGLPAVQISNGYTFGDLKHDILILYQISKELRKRRFEDGALAINSIKLWFALDEDQNPTDTGVYMIKEANKLIEEFMLLANMSVAKKISQTFPKASLLRQHSPPSKGSMVTFIELAAKLGFEINPETSSTLQASFDAIENNEIRQVLRLLCIKPMQRAKYFCTGSVDLSYFHHYALNVPLYTHFTSPIRRYCDLVVHRTLDFVLRKEPNPYSLKSIEAIAKQCNLRKDNSKNAQDASQRLFLCALLAKRLESDGNDSITEPALVYNVASRSFDVIVEKYGLEKRVYVEDLVDEGLALGSHYDGQGLALYIFWIRDATGAPAVDETVSHEDYSDMLSKLAADRSYKQEIDQSRIYVQKVGMFERIPIRIIPNMDKSPVDIRIVGAAPWTHIHSTRPSASMSGDITVVCPAITDIAD